MSIGKSKERNDKAYDDQSVITLMKKFVCAIQAPRFIEVEDNKMLVGEQIADVIRKMRSGSHIHGTDEDEWQNLTIIIKE